MLLGKFVSLCAAFDNENKTQALYMNGDKVEYTRVSLSQGDCFPLLKLFYICTVWDIWLHKLIKHKEVSDQNR